MTNSWLLDCFCFLMMRKYGDNPWRVTPDILGREYAPVLLIEACLGERALPLCFHAFVSPSPELKGCHFGDSRGMLWVFYDSTDDTWEQLITKFHEVGELVDQRLSELWPAYCVTSEIYDALAGDQRHDAFARNLAESVISLVTRTTFFILELMTGNWDSLERFLRPYAMAMGITAEELKDWTGILAGLILFILSALAKAWLQSIAQPTESPITRPAAIFEPVLTFFIRLLYLDRESDLTDLTKFGGAQCA